MTKNQFILSKSYLNINFLKALCFLFFCRYINLFLRKFKEKIKTMTFKQIPTIEIPVIRFSSSNDLELPSYATELSAGVDLLADVTDEITIKAGFREIINTGIGIEIPAGFEAQVRSRSGLAAKFGIMVLNSPGTIDADYRGEIKVILYNTSKDDFIIKRGMKIAQLVVAPVAKLIWNEQQTINETNRGKGGFGSTGI